MSERPDRPGPGEDVYVFPMSFAQQRLWFLAQLEPDSPSYNMPVAIRITGRLNVAALQQSLSEIVRRHEVLRTTFAMLEGEAVQLINPDRGVVLSLVELGHLPEEDREAAVQRVAREEARRPFDLTSGPLLRVHLLHLGALEHVLLLIIHHIVFDGWSAGLLASEFAALYPAFAAHRPAPLPPLPVQYADYAQWQRQWLRGEVLDAHLAHWRKELDGVPELLELPTDRPRPAAQTYRGARYRVLLPAAPVERLERLGHAQGATLFMSLLAAFEILLARYSGQRDFCIGTPIANRPRLELEGLIGFFVNTLVLRARLEESQSIRTWLGRVRESVLGAQAHQDLPFEQLVDALRPARALSHSPLVQAMFALQQPAPALEVPDLTVQLLEIDPGIAQFDLSLEIVLTPSGYQAAFEYSTDLFEEATIRRMAEHFVLVIERMAERPEARLSELSILSEAERRLLVMGNASDRAPALGAEDGALGVERGVHEFIEEQAARTPDAIAVRFESQTLTYGELESRANQVARELRRRGVGPDVLVGIYLERSIEMIVGLLGILKAGGGYVPLDPAHPRNRLAAILDDADLALVLTLEPLLSQLPSRGIELLCLDRDAPAVEAHSTARVESGIAPGNLAYVIYTSGSTGAPKGVLITHRSLATYTAFAKGAFGLQMSDRVLQFAALTFDASAEEIYPCLASGATLVLRTETMLESVATFLDTCDRWGITVLDLPTMYWHEIAARLEQGEGRILPAGLRLVIIGGEQARADRLAQWKRYGNPACGLLNTYGPTETTIVATVADLTHEVAASETPVSIGGLIPHARGYVLDANLQPVPIGVPGELHIGGVGVARGYLNRPDLTAEKFLPDPFSGDPGSRLYRTGDRVRRRYDGQLEFLGRVDHQIKLRGFRIELGEVESHIRAHPGVTDVVVMVREESGSPRLTAYVAGTPPPSAADLRRFLQERLPDYMLPAMFVFLPALPQTPTGKIDRRALPVPGPPTSVEGDRQAPRTRTETVLAEIWSTVLGVADIGIHDNFFERGGDSILSLQVVARAREAGVRLTPRQLFQHQTIAELAVIAGEASLVEEERGLVEGEVVLTPIQRWFFEQQLANPHHWNQTLLLTARGPVEMKLLEEAARAVLEHHDTLRIRFTHDGHRWTQQYAPSHPINADVIVPVDLSSVPREQRSVALESVANEWQQRVDLTEGPLLRAVWFDMGPAEPGRLLVVIHHLIVDAVSWWILLEDLQTAYLQRIRQQSIRLPGKTATFQRWARHLVDHARSPAMEAEAGYWLDLPLLGRPIPVDHPTGAQTESTSTVFTEDLSQPETEALLRTATSAYRMQVDEVLVAALAQTLVQWAGGGPVQIELEGHGREELHEDVDVSRTVGWFTTLYPVSLDVRPDAGPAEALKTVKEQLRRVPRRGIGYGLLRYLTAGDAAIRLQTQPQPPVSFNYFGQWDQALMSHALFDLAPEGTGEDRDPKGLRSYELEINGVIISGRLQLRWSYSRARYRPDTIEMLSGRVFTRLRTLIDHCGRPEAGGLTPSDVPLAGLEQAALDAVFGGDRDVEDVYPLTPLQQGLLFHTLYAPDSGVYVEQVSCTLEGDLDLIAFQRAWQQVMDHHPALRTAFLWEGEGVGRPLQVVRRQVPLPLTLLEWQDLPGETQRARLDEFVERDRKAGFDCARAPLLRLTVIKLAERVYRVVWTHHHLLLDGWCVPLLLKDVLVSYEAIRRGDSAALPARPLYRDFIAWLQQLDVSEAERYWQQVLQGLSAPTPLGIGRAAALGAQGNPVGSLVVALSPAATAALQTFVQRHHVTLSTVVQGAWALLLSRYSGESDVVFGVTVSGRSAPLDGIDSMIGLLINTVPLRVSVPAGASVGSWLKDLLAQNAALRHYEHTPLGRIQSCTQIPKGQPLFESLLVFENYPADPALFADLADLRVQAVSVDEHTNYPLTLTVSPGSELTMRCAYDAQRFDQEDIHRLLTHVVRLLEELAQGSERPLGEVSLLSEHEHRLLDDWNATERAYPQGRWVHELIEAQAERSPDATAVIFEGQRLTYRDLNARANQLARHLRRCGVGPDVLVGVCLERSFELVIALLGILKAGGAYVPIDPDYPVGRIAFMLEDMTAPLLVTRQGLVETLTGHEGRLVCLDRDATSIAREPVTNPNVPLSPQSLAYTIYTSGSTGRPKGAGIPHGGLLNRLLWMQEQYGLRADDRVLQKTPFSFDVSVWEFFWPLMTGASLVVASPGEHRQADRLVELIVTEGVTTLHFVPPMLQAFLETPAVKSCRSIRRVICSGEALPADLQRRFFERFHLAELHNLYGPTEASIDVTAWTCRRDDGSPSVPIGLPIANTQIHLLDPVGHPVPVGVAGELHIGGVGLARGYHNRPDLTADRFIPDPFSPRPGARLYRTGDLARRRSDGAIEFLGRLDHQVKVRGFRIELGEIEARLLEHPAVREAVVVVREDHPGEKRLVAYAVGADSTVQADQLRAWLARHLPEHMVPAFILMLDSLPLTPNGKVDRKMLPPPGPAAIGSREYVAPRTRAEHLLAEIWAQVLHLERIGIHDNFFDLGGDSIVTLQIVARAHQQGLKLTPRDLFDHPTVAGVAAVARFDEEPRSSSDTHPADEFTGVHLNPQELDQLLEEIR